VFCAHAQGGAAGDQYLEVGATRQEFRHERRRVKHVLEIIQHKQQLAVGQIQ
jgi:hypothetical protein